MPKYMYTRAVTSDAVTAEVDSGDSGDESALAQLDLTEYPMYREYS